MRGKPTHLMQHSLDQESRLRPNKARTILAGTSGETCTPELSVYALGEASFSPPTHRMTKNEPS